MNIFDRNLHDAIWGGNCTNAPADESVLTLEKIHESMERMRRILEEPMPPSPPVHFMPGLDIGFRIHETPHAVRRERIKTYPKRKARTPAHWARMDKKWRKRYGWREVPQAYFFNGDLGGMSMGKGLMIHPSQLAVIRNLGK